MSSYAKYSYRVCPLKVWWTAQVIDLFHEWSPHTITAAVEWSVLLPMHFAALPLRSLFIHMWTLNANCHSNPRVHCFVAAACFVAVAFCCVGWALAAFCSSAPSWELISRKWYTTIRTTETEPRNMASRYRSSSEIMVDRVGYANVVGVVLFGFKLLMT